jgi:DNA-binding LacI/PurR family transcriptional regulator
MWDISVLAPRAKAQDVAPTGEQAASILLARIDDPDRTKQQYFASPKLVLRQSG